MSFDISSLAVMCVLVKSGFQSRHYKGLIDKVLQSVSLPGCRFLPSLQSYSEIIRKVVGFFLTTLVSAG